jgi:transcriptional regulator PpsR
MTRKAAAGPAQSPLIRDADATTVLRLVGTAADVALVLDGEGTVLDVIAHDRELLKAGLRDWRGRRWADTVTVESRAKAAELMRDALAHPPVDAAWRHLNHPVKGGPDLPVLYSTVALSADKRDPARTRVIAFGRDLRPTMTLQRRVVEAQQALERDYARYREAETRYRKLFQTSQEPTLVVDAATLKVTEVNAAGVALCGEAGERLVGTALVDAFDPAAAPALQALIASARSLGRHEPMVATLATPAGAAGPPSVSVTATFLRQEPGGVLIVRLLPVAPAAPAAAAGRPGGRLGAGAAPRAADSMLAAYLRGSADALVFTDAQGRIVQCNRSFVELAHLTSEEQALGQPLDRWLGRSGVEVDVLIANLRDLGPVGLYATQLRGEFGGTAEVEVSATRLEGTPEAAFAFSLRDVGRRLRPEPAAPREIAPSVHELTELVGRVPLKQIVSETSDLIEQMSIQAALQMSRDNRALAAQLLGLSRQSLYVKLRRHGLGDLPIEATE